MTRDAAYKLGLTVGKLAGYGEGYRAGLKAGRIEERAARVLEENKRLLARGGSG